MTIGEEVYKREYCESKIESFGNDRVGLMVDNVNKIYKDNPDPLIACCRFPEGKEIIEIKNDCKYVDDYKKPSLIQKVTNIKKL